MRADLGDVIRPVPMDLSLQESISVLKATLQVEQPAVLWLVNNAGTGKMGSYKEFDESAIQNTVWLNATSVALLCAVCLPFMPKGAHILNLSSQSSFQPTPYINLYGATKAFMRSYTRALNAELAHEGAGVTATAVCPGWVKTDLLESTRNGVAVRFPALVDPQPVAALAVRDAKRGRDMSVCTAYVKFMHALSKLFPHKWVMRTWTRSIKPYI